MPEVTPEVAEQLEINVRAELAKRAALKEDILEWGKVCFPEKFTAPFCREMHEYFVKIRKEPFTNTEAPRASAKTTIKCFLIPIFMALNHAKDFRHYLNVQATEVKALAVNMAILKEIESNVVLKTIYGDQRNLERWTGQQFVLTNGVVFTAVGAGQSIRGINYRNTRPDYIIIDDLYDEDDINNPEATLKKNDWFWGSLYACRATDKPTSVHVQGTAINAEDLMEKLKSVESVSSKTFRSILDWDNQLVLWPEVKSFKSLMLDRDLMGSLIFFREYQNERRDDSTSIIKRAWLQDWEYDPSELKFDRNFKLKASLLCCDPSIGAKAENDYSAYAVVYKARPTDAMCDYFYISNLLQAHHSLDERIKKLLSISSSQGTDRKISEVRIESISGFQDFTSECKRRTMLPVKEIKHVKDKIATLEAKSKFFENGKVKISKAIPPNIRDTLIYQLTTNHPKNDDLRDAVLLALDDSINWDWVG